MGRRRGGIGKEGGGAGGGCVRVREAWLEMIRGRGVGKGWMGAISYTRT